MTHALFLGRERRARRIGICCAVAVAALGLAATVPGVALAAPPVARYTCSSSAAGTTNCTPCLTSCATDTSSLFLAGRVVHFDATASSDPDGSVVQREWFQDAAGAACPDPAVPDPAGQAIGSGAQIDHVFAQGGTFPVSLRVHDDDGELDVKCRTIKVNVAPVAGFAFAAPSGTPEPGEAVSFDAAPSSDPGATTPVKAGIAAFAWTFPGRPIVSAPTASHTFGQPGTYPVRLAVTDLDGTTTVAEQAIRVNAPPVAAFSFAAPGGSARAREPIAFDASGSSDDRAIADYAWDFGDGAGAGGATPSHAFAAPGAYRVNLRVTDDDGVATATTAVVEVPGAPLEARFRYATPGGIVRVERTVRFDARASIPSDGTIAAYHWSFGDGATADGIRVRHRFHTVRAYRVTLTVTHRDGRTAAMEQRLRVRPLRACPPIRKGALRRGAALLGARADGYDGRAGNDVIFGGRGDDCLLGGGGNDRIVGDGGDDRVVGGAGADRLSGGLDDDVIGSHGDARRDRISCGSGYDVVYADRRDRVARDCEHVRRQAPPRLLLP